MDDAVIKKSYLTSGSKIGVGCIIENCIILSPLITKEKETFKNSFYLNGKWHFLKEEKV